MWKLRLILERQDKAKPDGDALCIVHIGGFYQAKVEESPGHPEQRDNGTIHVYPKRHLLIVGR